MTARWTTRRLITWLESIGCPGPIIQGPELPPDPDVCTVVTALPRTATLFDGAGDQTGFQVVFRGPKRRGPGGLTASDVAEDNALLGDHLITRALLPADVDGVHLAWVQRLSGPSPAGPAPDRAERPTWSATYVNAVLEPQE